MGHLLFIKCAPISTALPTGSVGAYVSYSVWVEAEQSCAWGEMLFPEPARVTVITVVGPTLAATAVTKPMTVI